MTMRFAFLLPLLLAACTTGTSPVAQTPTTPDALAQVGRWELQGATDAHGQPIAAVLPNGKAEHVALFADGALAIEGGCNHMGGRYDIDGQGRLVVSEIRSTPMAGAAAGWPSVLPRRADRCGSRGEG